MMQYWLLVHNVYKSLARRGSNDPWTETSNMEVVSDRELWQAAAWHALADPVI